METPLIRPGAVQSPDASFRLVVHFYNAAEANLAIQILGTLGVPGDRIGVVDPDRMAGGRGMVVSVHCPDEPTRVRAEDVCRRLGGEVHRWRD